MILLVHCAAGRIIWNDLGSGRLRRPARKIYSGVFDVVAAPTEHDVRLVEAPPRRRPPHFTATHRRIR